MKKKGFTLIELLAVIIVLGIIALIAVPAVTNIINEAKENAAKISLYNYVESVENYQSLANLTNKETLKQGKYNVAQNTGDVRKINDLINLKGKKPTAGTIDIGNNIVTGAVVCINEYVVRYINKRVEVVGNECEDLGIFASYSTEQSGWKNSRNLVMSIQKDHMNII